METSKISVSNGGPYSGFGATRKGLCERPSKNDGSYSQGAEQPDAMQPKTPLGEIAKYFQSARAVQISIKFYLKFQCVRFKILSTTGRELFKSQD
jgi:hypothetical protein